MMETVRPRAYVPARRQMSASRNAVVSVKGGWGEDLERDMPVAAATALPSHAGGSLPRVMQPLRVEPPADYNSPARVTPLSSAKSPGGTGKLSRSDVADATLARLARRPLVGTPTAKVKAERMRDYRMLEAACRRAGRAAHAGTFSFNQGVLLDNMGEADEAVRCYKEVLKAAVDAGDETAEALACNCIGVNLQLRAASSSPPDRRGADGGDPTSAAQDAAGAGLGEEAAAQLREAIVYHERHVNVADVPGRFIAHSNLGLAYQALDQLDSAAQQHKAALRYAIRMSSLAGESLACAHLGAVKQRADAATAKACTERRLLLARTLGDAHGKSDAYLQLGALAHDARKWSEAHEHFDRAMRAAEQTGDRAALDLARCSLGVVDGSSQFETFLASLAAGDVQ